MITDTFLDQYLILLQIFLFLEIDNSKAVIVRRSNINDFPLENPQPYFPTVRFLGVSYFLLEGSVMR